MGKIFGFLCVVCLFVCLFMGGVCLVLTRRERVHGKRVKFKKLGTKGIDGFESGCEEIKRHEIQRRAGGVTSLHEENVCPAS